LSLRTSAIQRRSFVSFNRIDSLEMLERRVLLSAAFVPTTTNLHDIHHGPLAIAGGNLADLYLNYKTALSAGTVHAFEASAAAQTNSAGGSAVDVAGGTVGLELVGIGSLSTFEQQMQAMGFSIQSITPKDNAIGGFLPIGMLSQVAQSGDVLHITPLVKPTAFQEGSAPNQADQALQAAGARTTYNVTGAGVTVGVISDSVNQYGGGLASSVASGDLPNNVKVINDGTAGDTDEGRAILEQIYDLAPGASLVFDSAGETQQSMAAAVAALQAAGCNVIIDDIGFEQEPFFQPGVIDAAIDTAVAAGVTYVTAAGNDGTAGFEQAATFVAATDGSGDQLINFNAAGTTPATMMSITITGDEGPADLTLEWDDAYDGVTGTVTADLNFNLYSADGQQLRYSSTDNTFATGVPVQTIPDVAPGRYQVQIVAVNTPTASLPGYYEFTGGFTSFSTEFTGLHTSIVGHSGFSNAISVGAVAFNNTPAFTKVTPIPTEPFSSAGPVIEARDGTGALLPTPVTINVPEVSSTDGNNTSFFEPGDITGTDPTSFPQFFGTSAAAGNAAGVVALMKQAVPGATPAQILAALEATAIPVNGQTADTYNVSGGFGLIDATTAIANLLSSTSGSSGGGSGGSGGTTVTPPAATIVPVSPNPRSNPVSVIDIDFNEPVNGFGLSDLILTLNGGANLITTNQTLSTTNDEDFVLGNLSSITAAFGSYVLALKATGSGITGSGGDALANGASTSFTVAAIVGIPTSPSHVTAIANTSGSISLTFEQPIGNSLQGFTVERATNSSFKGKVTTRTLADGTLQFTDSNVTPGTVYYYQVAAFNADGISAFSRAATVITYNPGEVIMDTNSAGVQINGAWTASTVTGGYEGANYLQDDDSNKGLDSVKYHPDLAAAGLYDVYASWTSASDRATRVPIDIYSKAGVLLQTVKVNERSSGGDGWVLLGQYFLHSGTISFVRMRNSSTTGEVIANGVKFLPVGDIERNDSIFAPVTTAAPTTTAKAAAITRSVTPPLPNDLDTDELKALREEVG
jgi:hypothetical protein